MILDGVASWKIHRKRLPACGYNGQVQEIVKECMENRYKELKSVDFVAQHMTKETKLCTKNMHTETTHIHIYIEMARIITIITQLWLLLEQQVPPQTLIYMIFIIMINGDRSYLGLDDCCYPPSSSLSWSLIIEVQDPFGEIGQFQAELVRILAVHMIRSWEVRMWLSLEM